METLRLQTNLQESRRTPCACSAEALTPVTALPGPVHTIRTSGEVSPGREQPGFWSHPAWGPPLTKGDALSNLLGSLHGLVFFSLKSHRLLCALNESAYAYDHRPPPPPAAFVPPQASGMTYLDENRVTKKQKVFQFLQPMLKLSRTLRLREHSREGLPQAPQCPHPYNSMYTYLQGYPPLVTRSLTLDLA